MRARALLLPLAMTRALQPSPAAHRFLLARHGETNFNAEGRIQGTLDASMLTNRGHQQAKGLGAYVAENEAERIAHVWVSPMRRARQTLEAVEAACAAAGIALPAATARDDLREIELHHWEGRLKTDLMNDGWAEWKKDPAAYVMPNGARPLPDLWERAVGNWVAIRDGSATAAGATLVVSHGALGRCMVAAALGGSMDTFKSPRYAFDNCECVEVAWEPGAPAASHWRRLHTEKTPWESAAAQKRAAPGYVGGDFAALQGF
mmetsp:Transcript_16186/g.48133  ORF Transcript_16186/g.48133 Transcript_16186/m.48133 type:complete len:262 (-) Transcript_16186:12-797(-)